MLNKAIEAIQLENFQEAKALIDSILRINSKNSEALRLLSIVYAMQGDSLSALTAIRKVIKLDPRNGIAHSNHGNILRGLGRNEEAITSYKLALQFAPEYAEAHNNLANLYQELRLYEQSLPGYIKAIELQSDYAEAYTNLGNALSKLKRYEEALQSYIRAYELKPDQKFLLGNILHHKMLICDWLNFDELLSKITFDLRNGKKVIEPFGFQGASSSESDLLLAAEIFSADHFPSVEGGASSKKDKKRDVIRIGYVCGEFRDHATSRLMTGVYECHDKNRFKVIALDNGIDDGSDLRKRIESAVDQIISIKNKSTQAVVGLVRELEIDILINLNGFYGDGRQDVFALRPAPIQVNYLGFPGTIGVNYFDYLIADKIVIPESSQDFYREKVAYLPNSYQANDSKRAISEKNFTRQELGLPDEAFVFCCFNNNYKITPHMFDCWMRILDSVPKSVLWLIEDNPSASKNLRLEAVKRGVSEERVIFAERIPLPEHLARHRLADLFLDTIPYNAHTTASDSLWAGLPVLTCVGESFPGRVAASLLYAIDLPEMVVDDIREYERLAIELAKNPSELEVVRAKLLINKANSPLFNTPLFTKNLESLYIEMVSKH